MSQSKIQWHSESYISDSFYDVIMPDGYVDIDGFEGRYCINNKGDVLSYFKRIHGFDFKKLKPRLHTGGYWKASLHKNSKHYYRYVHRLVAKAFIPNPKNLPQVNHKDGNKKNNNMTNLEWCDGFHNQKHSYQIGLRTREQMIYANACKKQKVSFEQAEEMRWLRQNGWLCKDIGQKFVIGRSLITAILHNRKYVNG
jgi:HNH endonuclease